MTDPTAIQIFTDSSSNLWSSITNIGINKYSIVALGQNAADPSNSAINNTNSNNIVIGSGAAQDYLNLNNSVFLGVGAGSDSCGNNCIGLGTQALRGNHGNNCVGIGNATIGVLNDSNPTPNVRNKGQRNTAIGNYSLAHNTTGQSNTGIGYNCLYNNTTGSDNASIGQYSLEYNRDGSLNTAIGGYSLNSNTTGTGNTAIGYKSLFSNSSGNGNIAIGQKALLNSTGIGANIAIGNNSFSNLSGGNFNLAIGNQTNASSDAILGQYNTILGNFSDLSSNNPLFTPTMNYNLLLGNNNIVVDTSNCILIGNNLTSSTTGEMIIDSLDTNGNSQLNNIYIGQTGSKNITMNGLVNCSDNLTVNGTISTPTGTVQSTSSTSTLRNKSTSTKNNLIDGTPVGPNDTIIGLESAKFYNNNNTRYALRTAIIKNSTVSPIVDPSNNVDLSSLTSLLVSDVNRLNTKISAISSIETRLVVYETLGGVIPSTSWSTNYQIPWSSPSILPLDINFTESDLTSDPLSGDPKSVQLSPVYYISKTNNQIYPLKVYATVNPKSCTTTQCAFEIIALGSNISTNNGDYLVFFATCNL